MQANITKNVAIGGLTLSSTVALTGEHSEVLDVLVPAAKAAVVTSVTTAHTAGTLTASTGHGLTTGLLVDLFWAGGTRTGVTIGTVAVNSIPVTGGAGDLLPNAATVIMIAPRTSTEIVVGDTSLLSLLTIQSPVTGYAKIVSGAVEAEVVLKETVLNGVWSWSAQDGSGANPLGATAVSRVHLSHGSSAAQRMRVAFLLP